MHGGPARRGGALDHENGYPNKEPPIELEAIHEGVPCKWAAYIVSTSFGVGKGDKTHPWTQVGLTLGALESHPPRMRAAPGQVYEEKGAPAPEGDWETTFRSLWASAVLGCESKIRADPAFLSLREKHEIASSAGAARAEGYAAPRL